MGTATNGRRRKKASGGYLDGQLLIAMPAMTDPRFARSVIYLCLHSAEGAMGLIVNQRASNISFTKLLRQLDIVDKDGEDEVPPEILSMSVNIGGPVETGRGFVLHSGDYFVKGATMRVDEEVSLTATLDILKAMAAGQGPNQAIMVLGYAGWAPGQLESEIQANGWLHCAADADLLYDPSVELKYDRALSKLGIDLSHLVSDAGHA